MSEPDRFSETNVLSTFASDIGNALAGVLSATQALLNGGESDPIFRRDLLGAMEDRLQTLRILYENWVFSSSFNLKTLSIVPRAIESAEWLLNLLAPWKQRGSEKGLMWEVQVGADHPEIRFDLDLVELAIENLLSASIAAAPNRTRLLVMCGFSEPQVLRIEISDQGPRLSGERLVTVLKRPHDVRPASPRIEDGRSLRLRVAGAIAEIHGGRLEAFDREGYSCSLRLTIRDQPAEPQLPDHQP